MLLIPEIETVVILTPRTGTRALKNAVLRTYPQATLLYRHMEADGVPQGYDRWRKVGVVRNPIARLWSLYKYLKDFGVKWSVKHDQDYTRSMRESVAAPFEEWLLTNQLPFTTPYDSAGLGRFFAAYTVRHPLPENRKSQFVYLRPDLGTVVWPYKHVVQLHRALGVNPYIENETPIEAFPDIGRDATDYVERWLQWDLEACKGSCPTLLS